MIFAFSGGSQTRFLLIAVIVLAVTPFTYAGIVLSVDGDTTVSSKVMGSAETIDVGIYVEGADTPTINSTTGMATDGSTLLAGGNFKIAVRSGTGGTLNSSAVVFPGEFYPSFENIVNTVQFSTSAGTFSVGPAYWEVVYSVYDSSSTHMSITGGNIYSNAIGNTQLQDDLLYTAAGGGTYYIDLIAASDIVYYNWLITWDPFEEEYKIDLYPPDPIEIIYPQGTVIDTITVTPEPATLLLLGAGGLMLRRKRTAAK